MSAIRKLASQTAIYGLSSIIGRLAVWGLTPLYTSRMLEGEYGVFSNLYSFVTYFLVILTFGMETSFFRFSMGEKDGKNPYNQGFYFVSLMALLFLGIFGSGHEPIAEWMGYGNRSMLVLMVVGIIFLDVMTALPMARLRFEERPKVFAAISLFNIFLTIGLNVWFYYFQGETTAEYVFISNLIASAVKFGIFFIISLPLNFLWDALGNAGTKLKEISAFPSTLSLDPKLLKSMLGFGVFIMLAGISGMINQYSDVNFVNYLWGSEPSPFEGNNWTGSQMAGIYSANKKLAVIILMVTQAFKYAAEPFFFKQAENKKSRVTFARVFHYFMLLAMAAFLAVSGFAYELVSYDALGFTLIAESYWSGLGAVPIILIAFALSGAYTNISIWFKLTKQVRFGVLFSLAGTIVIVIVNVFFVQLIGYYASALAMMLGFLTMVVLCYIVGQKYYPIPYQIGRLVIYSIPVAMTFGGMQWLGDSRMFSSVFWAKLGLFAICATIIYLLERKYPLFKNAKQNVRRERNIEIPPIDEGDDTKPD